MFQTLFLRAIQLDAHAKFRMLEDSTAAKQAKCSIRRLISCVRGANFM